MGAYLLLSLLACLDTLATCRGGELSCWGSGEMQPGELWSTLLLQTGSLHLH
jgi:hypothetical protein